MTARILDFYSSRCAKLADPDFYSTALAVALLFGIVVSYVPQHYKIIKRHTSRGLNPFFLLLGTISGVAGLGNILTSPLSQADLGCCRKIGRGACAIALLGIGQVGAQFLCFFLILLLWLVFFPRGENRKGYSGWDTWHEAVLIGIVSVVFFLVVLAISLWFTVADRNHLGALANTLGLTSATTAAVQYFPQIWTTFRLRRVESLSIPMMCIQTPGSALWAFSLYQRYGLAGWSTWGVYLLTGTLQGVLLGLAISYRNNDADESPAPDVVSESPDETRPLLQDHDRVQENHIASQGQS